jgi:RNA polymerase sigma-70 factor (ECF subfamily)
MMAFVTTTGFFAPARMDVSDNHSASTTPELLVQVAAGDAQAFSVLYDHTSSVLFTLAMRILNNREEASELLQDVYIEVWRKASSFDSQRGSPLAWMITLTRSRAIDRLRSAAVRGANVTDSIHDKPVDELPSYAPDPLEVRSLQEFRARVVNAVMELPTAQQEAIELAYYEGLTHTEIAARLNQPVGTIKTRIKLGMNKLRYALRPSMETK